MEKSDYSKLIEFIKRYELPKGNNEKHTHVSWTSQSDLNFKFSVPESKYETFKILYSKAISSGVEMGIGEVAEETSILYIDADFKQSSSKRLYLDSDIQEIISATNELLVSSFGIPLEHLGALVQEKPSPSIKKDRYGDGFHIIYPEVYLSSSSRYSIIRLLSQMAVNEEILKYLEVSEKEKIMDEAIVNRNTIKLYGSFKPGSRSYEITHYYFPHTDGSLEDLIDDYTCLDDDFEIKKDSALIDLMFFRGYDESMEITPLSGSIVEQMNEEIEKGKTEKPKDDYGNDNVYKVEPKRRYYSRDDVLYARKLTRCLDPEKRAREYSDWIKLCWVLNAISLELFEEFDNLSSKVKNYDKKSCINAWNKANIKVSSYTISTLIAWAEEDDCDLYNEYRIRRKMTKHRSVFDSAICAEDIPVAHLVRELYGENHVYTGPESGWLFFDKHRWVFDEKGLRFRLVLIKNLAKDVKRYEVEGDIEFMKDYQKGKLTSADLESRKKKFKQFYRFINGITRINSIITACESLLLDKEIADLMDENRALIGFNNGVYDLREMVFRDGRRDDYVSKTVGYDYVTEVNGVPLSENHSDVLKIIKFFKTIQQEGDMYTYLMLLMASILKGGTDSKLHFFTGSGANGKSTLLDLLNKTFGEYYSNLSPTALTADRPSSNSHQQEITEQKGTRLIVFQEPCTNSHFNMGRVKELTGNDTMSIRQIWGKKTKKLVFQAKLFIACNEIPKIKETDYGTWRRINCMPFDIKFVESNPDYNNKEALGDKDAAYKIGKLVQPLMWLLINKFYPIYATSEFVIEEPAKVKEFTSQFKIRSDKYLAFMLDRTNYPIKERTPEENKKYVQKSIKFEYLFNMLRGWYKATCNANPNYIPPKIEFKDYLIRNLKLIIFEDGTIKGLYEAIVDIEQEFNNNNQLFSRT